MSADGKRRFAIVTGASTGIGLELAKCCARDGFDLLIAADESDIHDAATELQSMGVAVEAVEADLATMKGVEELYAAAKGRPVDALLANAGRGLGKAFLDQDFAEAQRVVDTNITGTICLIHKVGNDMRGNGGGKILITGSIAGFTPGAFQAVYHGTKAFIDSFSHAIRNELKDTGHRHLPDAGRDPDRVLRAGRSDGHQNRPGREGRRRRRRRAGFQGDDERRQSNHHELA
jgi:short-subunit dehydrogenase